MIRCVGVGFKDVGKIYYFNPKNYNLHIGSMVVVETARGLELAKVMTDVVEFEDDKFEHELKDVVRPATENDIINFIENEREAASLAPFIKEMIKECGLDMKYVGCEYTLDGSKIIIHYTADERVDFRELVKRLVQELRVRIELRQIGPRESAKIMGGIGECGRQVCCATHLREFNQVTMKMAKDQNMSLSANKITGICGKLMCCIGYEECVYLDAKKRLPGVGDIVDTEFGPGRVVLGVDYIKETVQVKKDEDTLVNLKASDVIITKRRHVKRDEEEDNETIA